METKLTAVQWLLEHDYLIRTTKWKDIVEQALAMEKEQIVNAHLLGLIHPLEIEATKQAEQYYNETYNNSKTPPGAHCEEA